MDNSWIKIFRKLRNWEWYKKPNMVHLFIHLLLCANHKDNNWQGVEIKRGQFLTGRKSLSEDTGISEQSIRTCLINLKSTNEITIKTTNKYSIITLCNYEYYQNEKEITNQQLTNQLTNNQPTINQQLTTNKNIKNDNKGNHLYKNSEFYDNISLIKEKIGIKYHGYNLTYYNEVVKNWSASKGAMKKDWIATIRNFILGDIKKGNPRYAK